MRETELKTKLKIKTPCNILDMCIRLKVKVGTGCEEVRVMLKNPTK